MLKLAFVLIAVLCLALTGCAAGPQAKKAPTEFNSEYMTKVEYYNSRAGSRTIWVNPPTRARLAEDESNS